MTSYESNHRMIEAEKRVSPSKMEHIGTDQVGSKSNYSNRTPMND